MRILIGYDGSSGAKAAVADLRRAALPDHTEAIVLTVADVWPSLLAENSDPIPAGSRHAIEEFMQPARAQAEQAMTEATSLAALIGSVSSSVAARAGCSVEVIRSVEP